MGKRRDSPTAATDAILQVLIETIYGPPEEADMRLQALTAALTAVMVLAPLRLPGSGLSLWGFPDALRNRDGRADWNLPAAEVCAELRKAFDHLAGWKRSLEELGAPNEGGIRQSGSPMPVTLRMSLGNDSANPHRHFLALHGSPKDVFIALTLLLLAHGTTAKVLTCPGCHKVFFRANRRQTHCGKKCYNRRYWRESYTPQQKANARQAQYKKNGWLLGAKGSPLGQLKRSVRARPSSSKKERGD